MKGGIPMMKRLKNWFSAATTIFVLSLFDSKLARTYMKEFFIATMLGLLTLAVVAIELTALAVGFRFAFLLSWRQSFVTALILLAIIYAFYSWRVGCREKKDQRFMFKHMETL